MKNSMEKMKSLIIIIKEITEEEMISGLNLTTIIVMETLNTTIITIIIKIKDRIKIKVSLRKKDFNYQPMKREIMME